MNLWEMVLTAFASLAANKLRSFLTMLGILIGVGSILAIVALGGAGKQAIIATIESTRAQNTIQILPTEAVQPGLPQPGQVLQFTPPDFQVAQGFGGVLGVNYSLFGQASVTSGDQQVNVSVEAGPSDLNELGHFIIIDGRMYDAIDVLAHRPVVLLSQPLAIKLFGHKNPLGQVVQLGGRPLQVVGVTASTQVNLLAGLLGSDYLYLPATTCRDIFPWWTISEMDVQVAPGVDKTQLGHRIVMALNIRAHNATAFEDSALFLVGVEKTIGAVTSILTIVIGAIAGIALIVGGVGVMNIMLVSVTERTQEIGIRMSLGATRRAILFQFLIESVLITTLGGFIGIGCGLAAAQVVHWWLQFPVPIPWQAVIGSFVFSGLVGIVCGLYPSNKAARMNPIDALRHE